MDSLASLVMFSGSWMMGPEFPIYIPSKSRWKSALTPRFLDAINVPYRLVVEEHQAEDYAKIFGDEKIVLLDPAYQDDYDPLMELEPGQSKGSGPARNFIWDHSVKEGHPFHWIMDDNIISFGRFHNNQRITVLDGVIFAAMEDFMQRYKNLAQVGPQYLMFLPSRIKKPPFILNTRIFSCMLIRNSVPFRWRGRYNEDLDLSLRMLKANWTTVQFNAFYQWKMRTQKMTGGNTEAFYADEGTLAKSKMAVKSHPDVVKLAFKYGRWHHSADFSGFTQQLIKDDSYTPRDFSQIKFKKVPTRYKLETKVRE